MIIWTITAAAAACMTILILIAYRRQVKKVCRQLAFLKDHQTNLCLTSNLPFKELNEMADGINGIWIYPVKSGNQLNTARTASKRPSQICRTISARR